MKPFIFNTLLSFFLLISTCTFSQTSNAMEATNQQLITRFYTAFQKRDYKGMQECYADTATFSDAVFVNLNSAEVKSMWEMLCIRGKDLTLEFRDVKAQGSTVTAEWKAYYTFSVSNRKVINLVKADFVIENGKIVKHTDTFDFYKWSKQALGAPGLLLGWTNFLKNTVRKTARKSLNDFMNKKGAGN